MSLKINIVEGSIRDKGKDPNEKRLPGLEAVHHPNERSWIGEQIRLHDHFQEFSALVYQTYCPGFVKSDLKTTDKKIKECMECDERGIIDDTMFNEIVENCDIDQFT